MRRFLILCADIVALAGALALTIWARYPDTFEAQFLLHGIPFLLIGLAWIIGLYIANLYDLTAQNTSAHIASGVIQGAALASAASIALFYLSPFFEITPKTNLFLFITIATCLLITARMIVIRASARIALRTLFIGTDAATEEVMGALVANPYLGYIPLRMPEGFDILSAITHGAYDIIVVGPQAHTTHRVRDLFAACMEHNVRFMRLSDFAEMALGKVVLGAVDNEWVTSNIPTASQRGYAIAKRAVDITCAVVLGIPTLLALPLVAGAIRLSSPGPLLYRQMRIGKGLKPFTLLKFRSMVANAEAHTGAVWAQKEDPRVTRFGRFMRKTRIDELPQLWNVLKGELSFVGPRAERPEFHGMLRDAIPFYNERYLVTPGLTGLAQILYDYGASVRDAAEKLQYDLYYIKHRSLVLDVSILLRTIALVLFGKGR
ncbi:MAG: sugar transferase [Candidatus Paceibacterota bacterium]|nr:MAG: sugar transferase [Candidatus Paceibacterota bacterium]